MWLFSKKLDAYEIERVVDFNHRYIRRLINSYNKYGLDFAYEAYVYSTMGKKTTLNEEEQALLKKAILEEIPPSGGIWSAPQIVLWIKEKLSKKIMVRAAYEYIKRLNLTLQVPRPRNYRAASQEQQDDWKKNSTTK